MVQPVEKVDIPWKVKHRVTMWPSSSGPRLVHKRIENTIHPHRNLCMFIIAQRWKQPRCLSTGEWKKMWYIDTAKSLQSCPTLCDPIDGSPPGSPVPGILQARTLEWVAVSFSNAWKWKVKVKSLSRVRLLATPWTAAHQAPLSMGFSRQEYWSGLPLPPPNLLLELSFFPFS